MIELYRDGKSRMSRSVDVDEPDARFYVKEKRIEITPSGAGRLEAKPEPPAPHVSVGQTPSVDEYAALMGRLTGAKAPSPFVSPSPAPAPAERQVTVLPKPEFKP